MLMKCSGLMLGYDKKVISPAIDLSVREGDFIAVTGENGAGKSTLVKTLLGLIPPIGGEVTLGAGMRSCDIGYLPQSSFTPKDFPASVGEVVLSGCIAKEGSFPFYRKKHKEKAAMTMKRLGISEYKKRCFRELSGGQAQRVLLCRALCAADRMLLLDEPVSGLDPSATHEMYEAVRDLNKNDNMAVIMVSHDICTTLGYASHILHIGSQGVFFGTVDEYRRSEVGHEFIFAHGGICDCEQHTPEKHEHSHTHSHNHAHQKEEGEEK